MKMQRFALLAAVGCAVVVGQSSLAAPLVEESFDGYTTGGANLAGNNGGTGFSGAWVNTKNSPDVFADGEDISTNTNPAHPSHGTMTGSGNFSRGGAWSGVARPIAGSALAGNNLLDNGAELWFSVRFGLDKQNFSNADINVALANADAFANDFGNRENLDLAASEGIGVGHSGGVVEAAYWQNTDGAADTFAEKTHNASSQAMSLESPYVYIVGKIVWGATDLDGEKITLYDETLTQTMAEWTTPALSQSTFDMLLIQYKDNSQVDEIRFGASSSDVVIPEPSSLALLGLGGLLIARRRRG